MPAIDLDRPQAQFLETAVDRALPFMPQPTCRLRQPPFPKVAKGAAPPLGKNTAIAYRLPRLN